jgi:WhiB family redox-sensing transcriptional regulator
MTHNHLLKIVAPAPWMAAAACSGLSTDLFHPSVGDKATSAQAKKVCRGCPVILDCRRYAIVNNERLGVWGGMTIKERRQERTKMIMRGDLILPPSRLHGAVGTYLTGCRCAPCVVTYGAYRKGRRVKGR